MLLHEFLEDAARRSPDAVAHELGKLEVATPDVGGQA